VQPPRAKEVLFKLLKEKRAEKELLESEIAKLEECATTDQAQIQAANVAEEKLTLK